MDKSKPLKKWPTSNWKSKKERKRRKKKRNKKRKLLLISLWCDALGRKQQKRVSSLRVRASLRLQSQLPKTRLRASNRLRRANRAKVNDIDLTMFNVKTEIISSSSKIVQLPQSFFKHIFYFADALFIPDLALLSS